LGGGSQCVLYRKGIKRQFAIVGLCSFAMHLFLAHFRLWLFDHKADASTDMGCLSNPSISEMILIRLTWIIENSIIPKIGLIRSQSIAMADRREKIDRLLAEVERESYARGWHDAIAALQSKAPEIPPDEFAPEAPENETRVDSATSPRQRGRPAKAINLVRDEIFAEPGLRGADVTRALAKKGTPVIDRTVRSCLRRLRDNRIIWQRKYRWYPRPKERQDAGNEIGEASKTPPH
jgi:hypothetical protein